MRKVSNYTQFYFSCDRANGMVQLGTRPSGISAQPTTNATWLIPKLYTSFSDRISTTAKFGFLETEIIGHPYIQIMINNAQ